MKVTDLNYAMEDKLVEKLDLMIDRCQKKDALLIIEGSEGEGKTNASEVVAYYIKHKTGRTINMFFRLEPMIEFAKKTEGQLIIWDEPSLDFLSVDWHKKVNINLIRLLMTCRKKKHFFIFNFVKFYKFSEYIVVDRLHGFIHMYTRGNNQQGRFIYVRKKKMETLYLLYKNKKIRAYKQCMSFGGWFPLIEKHFERLDLTIEGKEHCTLADYERLKDVAIDSIGSEEEKKPNRITKQRNALFYILNKELHLSQEEIAQRLEKLTGDAIAQNTISESISQYG